MKRNKSFAFIPFSGNILQPCVRFPPSPFFFFETEKMSAPLLTSLKARALSTRLEFKFGISKESDWYSIRKSAIEAEIGPLSKYGGGGMLQFLQQFYLFKFTFFYLFKNVNYYFFFF